MMTDKLSECISMYLLRYKIIDSSMTDIVKLGIEVIISTIVNLAGIFFLGILFGRFLETVFFSLCFMTIRNYSGGYHAATRLKCNLSLWTVTFLVLMVLHFTGSRTFIQCIIGIVLSGLILMIIGPLENKHKPLSANIKEINRRYMIMWFCFWSIMSIVLYHVCSSISVTILLTEIAIVILLILERGRCYYAEKHT